MTCVCVCHQGKEPSVRQLALLHFRNIITLNLKLDEALSRPRARVPPSIIQMLLILQVRAYTHTHTHCLAPARPCTPVFDHLACAHIRERG